MSERNPEKILGKTFGFLRAVEVVRSDTYRCVCADCGRDDIVRSRATLQAATKRGSDNRCCIRRRLSADERFTDEDLKIRALLSKREEKAPPRLDVERNRERYVRLKLSVWKVGGGLRLFSDYACSRCNLAPECEKAFAKGNTKTKCVKGTK